MLLWLGRPVVDALESEVQFAAAAVLVVYGLSLLIPDKATPAKARFVLPVVLSLDNLGAGVALAAASAPAGAALLLGVMSGAMSAIGLGLGTRIGRLIPRYARTTAALAFLALAVGAVAA
jgi:putative Mn2+ efflux pump MntP